MVAPDVKHVQHDEKRQIGKEEEKTYPRKYIDDKEEYCHHQPCKQLYIIDIARYLVNDDTGFIFHYHFPAVMKPIGHHKVGVMLRARNDQWLLLLTFINIMVIDDDPQFKQSQQ